MDPELEQALASGDEDAIAAALENVEVTTEQLLGESSDVEETAEIKEDTVVEPEPADTKQTEAPEETDVKSDSSTPDEKLVSQEAEEQEDLNSENAVVSTKDGLKTIPYSVLSNARERAAETEKRLNESESQLEQERQARAEAEAKLAEQQRMNQMFTKQLENAGLDPEKTPEQILQDEESMSRLADENPEMAKLIQYLGQKVLSSEQGASQQQDQQSQIPTTTPVDFETAFNNTTDLKNWRENDLDRWELAVAKESQLLNDPSFANKSHSERLAEVERLVKAEFGDSAESPAQSKPEPKPVETPIPTSPSDIGNSRPDLNPNAQFFEQDGAAMASQMESMSEAQVEALLAEAADELY